MSTCRAPVALGTWSWDTGLVEVAPPKQGDRQPECHLTVRRLEWTRADHRGRVFQVMHPVGTGGGWGRAPGAATVISHVRNERPCSESLCSFSSLCLHTPFQDGFVAR